MTQLRIILRNFAQPMKLYDASNGPLLGRVGGRGVKPLLFSMCSHQESNGFPTSSSTYSQQHLPQSHMLCPLLSFWNLYGWPNIDTFIQFYIWSEYFYIGKYPKFQKLFVMGQSKRFIEKKFLIWKAAQLIPLTMIHQN